MDRKKSLYAITAILISMLCVSLFGCRAKPTKYYLNPYIAKDINSPEAIHCFSSIEHIRGASPFISGGTCCCTPTQKLITMYHEDGFLLDYDLLKLKAKYEGKSIILSHDNGWQCNNQCESGPHVVFGGQCMLAPVIGTQNFENVITGKMPKVKG